MNRRNIFSRDARGNVPPAARRGNKYWVRAQQRGSYLWNGDNREVWGGKRDYCGGGPVGKRIALTRSARLTPSSVVLTAKNENRNVNCERGCKGNSILKKSSLSA